MLTWGIPVSEGIQEVTVKKLNGNVYVLLVFVAALFSLVGCENDDRQGLEQQWDGWSVGIGTYWITKGVSSGRDFIFKSTLVEHREYNGRQVGVLETTYDVTAMPVGEGDGDSTRYVDLETGNQVATLVSGVPQVEAVPYDGRYDFPLDVGKTWRQTYHLTDRAKDFSGAVWADYEVLAFEEITVGAGTFMAYKVAITDASFDHENNVYWYAPEANSTLKSISDSLEYEVVEFSIEP